MLQLSFLANWRYNKADVRNNYSFSSDVRNNYTFPTPASQPLSEPLMLTPT